MVNEVNVLCEQDVVERLEKGFGLEKAQVIPPVYQHNRRAGRGACCP